MCLLAREIAKALAMVSGCSFVVKQLSENGFTC